MKKQNVDSNSNALHGKNLRGDLALFGNIRVLAAAALLAAMSLILGKFLQIPNPFSNIFRISLENLPIILAGVCFGPAVGGAVGIVADIVGCLLYGYTINPIVTLGAAVVGVVSGVVARYIIRKPRLLSVLLATISAHLLGSVLVKSFGLASWYLSEYSMGLTELMLWRLGLYCVIGTVECMLIYFLTTRRAVMRQIEKMRTRRK